MNAQTNLISKGNFLIVDDEENIREILSATLKGISNKIFVAGSAEEAMEIVKEENLDVVVCDIQMPGISGLEFLKIIKTEQPEIKFLMITAFGSMEVVVEALRSGASDFLTKPFDNNRLKEIVSKLLLEKNGRKEPITEITNSKSIGGIIGESKILKKSLDIAFKAAVGDSSILIMGESGTGKEVLAKAIHENSPRKSFPFIPVNCGAIPENLMESELFGYEKGAFTGAMEKKPGKFSLADNGSLFLDEIGDMPMSLQVKLLRVLQEKVVDPVGSVNSTPVDFRLIAATNKNLEEEVQNGNFREDLYYRLNIIPITLPPLRERGKDSVILADFFLQKFNDRYGSKFQLTDDEKNRIENYNWPGNIRELENVMERAVVLGEGSVLFINLPSVGSENKKTSSIKLAAKNSEREEIIKALERNRWNKTHTAKELGISRRSLLYKVKEYQI